MAYAGGLALVALGILVSICLHEAGHLGTAKAFGMKATQYFAGFGPTLWSFRRGETEYGVKALPLGGYVKIVGMTPLDDDVSDADQPRAFWRKPLWQRTVVLSAGSVTHFILGFVLLWVAAAFVGVPNPALAATDPEKAPPVIATVNDCVRLKYDRDDPLAAKCRADDPVSPAKKAGIRPGDRITALNGKPTRTYGDVVKATRDADPGPTPVTVVRDGRTLRLVVDLVPVERATGGTVEKPKLETFPMLGISNRPSDLPAFVTYGPVDGVGEAAALVGSGFANTFVALQRFPQKVPKLVDALAGEERDRETPISVVGVSRLGGEVAENGHWPVALLLLASLNLFIGVFNLFPLLPLDGGHIAIAWFERARSWLAGRRGRPDPGRVDYTRLMPVTYAVILVFGGLTLLTVAADIVNPITLYRR